MHNFSIVNTELCRTEQIECCIPGPRRKAEDIICMFGGQRLGHSPIFSSLIPLPKSVAAVPDYMSKVLIATDRYDMCKCVVYQRLALLGVL